MIERLLRFAKDPTSKNIIINTVGNYLNVVFVAFFALILVRILTPQEYGVLSVLLGIAYVLSNVLDFGTTATIYSYVPDLFFGNREGLYKFIKSTFFFQSLFSFIVLAILFIFFPYLDEVFFKTGVSKWILDLTSFSVLLLIWQNFFTNILFAAKKFVRANIYINFANIVKTGVLLVLAYFQMVNVGMIIFVFGVIGPIVFFILVLIKNNHLISLFLKAKIDRKEFRFGYTLTYFFASQFYNLGLRMDLFLLSFFGLTQQLGFYGLSQKIILTIITSIASITQVLSPRFAIISTKKDILKQIKTATIYLLVPSFIFVILYFTPNFIFEAVFTRKFGETTAITRALVLPFILNALGSVPTLFLLYTVKKPGYILFSNICFFLIISIGSFILIPTRGVFGPPFAILIAFIVATGIQVFASVREYRKLV